MSEVPDLKPGVPVLVADDDSNDSVLLEFAFERAGISADLHWVHDGQEAMEYLNGTGLYADRTVYPFPKLFLLDLKMPRVSGFEVLSWLQLQPELQKLFVVVLTGSESPAEILRCYALGADACVRKTCDPFRFASILRGLCRHYFSHAQRRKVRGRYTYPDNLFAVSSQPAG